MIIFKLFTNHIKKHAIDQYTDELHKQVATECVLCSGAIKSQTASIAKDNANEILSKFTLSNRLKSTSCHKK